MKIDFSHEDCRRSARLNNLVANPRTLVQEYVRLKEKSKSDEGKEKQDPKEIAFRRGQMLREITLRTIAITSDKSGETGKQFLNELEALEKNLEEQRETKKKENEEKYGGDPHLLQVAAECVEEVSNINCSRRAFLFGGPKKIATEAGLSSTWMLPWPLNRIAGLVKYMCGK